MREALTHRDVSALSFYKRVLGEAEREDNPLMERARFIQIVSAGLEEFQRVRLPRLKGEVRKRALGKLDALESAVDAAAGGLAAKLAAEKVFLRTVDDLSEDDRQWLQTYFENTIRPGMRKMEPAELSSGELALVQWEQDSMTLWKLPEKLPRLILIKGQTTQFVPVEQAAAYAMGVWPLRILRDEHHRCDVKSADICAGVKACLDKRRHGDVVRILVDQNMDDEEAERIVQLMDAEHAAIRRAEGVFHPGGVMAEMASLPGLGALHYTPFCPRNEGARDMLQALREKDRLLIHPYDSFEDVVRLLEQAAEDPSVETIAMTLYRVSGNARIPAALMQAAKGGKRVTVLIEVRARGDEEQNLRLVDEMRQSGCKVLTGLPGCKVHAKALLISRREDGEVRRYAHLGTGNYNERTARQYTDIGLMTADRELTGDVACFFETLEAPKEAREMHILTASPEGMRAELLRLIRRETSHAAMGRPCGMTLKLNALTDKTLIAALQEAGKGGVSVRLIVRGACRLQPEEGGNVTVRSLVGRFLEHGRAFRFVNGGEEEVYISSADWMPRSLDGRVELMTPIRDKDAAEKLKHYLEGQWEDTALIWNLTVDDYTAARCCAEKLIDSQAQCLKERMRLE